MFLVGLDVVGEKLKEVNVFSPGGFGSAEKLEKVNFTEALIDALARKVDYVRYYGRNFDNAEIVRSVGARGRSGRSGQPRRPD